MNPAKTPTFVSIDTMVVELREFNYKKNKYKMVLAVAWILNSYFMYTSIFTCFAVYGCLICN